MVETLISLSFLGYCFWMIKLFIEILKMVNGKQGKINISQAQCYMKRLQYFSDVQSFCLPIFSISMLYIKFRILLLVILWIRYSFFAHIFFCFWLFIYICIYFSFAQGRASWRSEKIKYETLQAFTNSPTPNREKATLFCTQPINH